MPRRDTSTLSLKPVLTVTELAEAAKMRRKTGQANGPKMARLLRSLGVPVRPGKPQTVLLADLHKSAPSFIPSLHLAATEEADGAA